MTKISIPITVTILCTIIGYSAWAIAKPAVAVQDPINSGKEVGTNPGNIYQHDGQPIHPSKPGDELAAFSEGCFWGSENVFRHVKGVVATAVGYTGGHLANPTYEEVCSHTTGHCETVLIEFDPKVVTYKNLLNDFWNSHDPTQVDGQGPDIGSNYRSAIWTFTAGQQKEATQSLRQAQKKLSSPITTSISKIGPFWLAEQYHQQYDEKNGVAACPVFLRKQSN